jgi:signal transduction histidine kinase
MEDMRKSLEEWKNTGEVKEKEIWMKRKDGSIFPAAISATSIYDENGVLIGSNTVIIDETDRYNARKTLEEANAELKKIDVMKTEFVNVAAHELRTPITPILVGAQLLSKSFPNDVRVAAVVNSAKKLNKLIGRLLDESRLGSGTFKLIKERTNVLELAKEIIHDVDLGISTNGKKVKLVLKNKIQYTGSDDYDLLLDKSRIAEVLTNLLDNAVKFTREGEIRLVLEKSKDNKDLVFTVADTGSGIDESIKDKLFQKFSTKSDGVSGTGLGLYLSRAIVEAHGGKIWCANNPDGKGAVFTFMIPIVKEESVSITEI